MWPDNGPGSLAGNTVTVRYEVLEPRRFKVCNIRLRLRAWSDDRGARHDLLGFGPILTTQGKVKTFRTFWTCRTHIRQICGNLVFLELLEGQTGSRQSDAVGLDGWRTERTTGSVRGPHTRCATPTIQHRQPDSERRPIQLEFPRSLTPTPERYRSGHNGLDSKSSRGGNPHVGSNPTLSAKQSVL